MDLTVIERSLRASEAAPVLADARLLRRVIKAHRRLSGFGLQVPHARCYALPREALLALVDPVELGRSLDSLPEDVLLLARPQASELAGRTSSDILGRLWRSAFHASIHAVLERRIAGGALSDATIRERIGGIGQTAFDEVRTALRHDDALLPPHGDREAFAEFAALYLELRHFAPALLGKVFPGLPPRAQVDAVLAADIDALALLARCSPEGADPLATIVREPARTTSPTFSAPRTLASIFAFSPRRENPAVARRLLAAAEGPRRKGNAVRAALLCAAAALSADPAGKARARAAARADLDTLAVRLHAALRPVGASADAPGVAWTSLLLIVAEEAAVRRGPLYPVEARLLYDLQRAAIAHEQPYRAVDLATWALSRGRRPVVRALPATREVRIARAVQSAAKKLRHVRVASADRKLLAKLLHWAEARADDNVRAALRPAIRGVLETVGLHPVNAPELVARDKLVEELLDQAVKRGFMSLTHLRDALSRNQLKLASLSGARELLDGDALLRADRLLSLSLDGVYRGGEVYLRGLQKLSSAAFGTTSGRLLTLYLVLPLGGAFVLLEGVSHVVGPLSQALGFEEVHLLSTMSFLVTAAALFALLHSEIARAYGKRALDLAGALLRLVFVRAPRWVLTRAPVRRFLESRAFRAVTRRVVLPLALAAAVDFLTPLGEASPAAAIGLGAFLLVAANVLLSSRLGALVEEVVVDALVRGARAMSHRVLPGLFRLVADTFKALLEIVERAIYKVDEWLRFRHGEGRAALVAKAGLGLAWFAVAYVIRLYITLLVEPEINPLKHFPVVTVAHKLVLPFTPALLVAGESALRPLGPVIAGTIAGTTVFLLPSVFGFLVWELKENWKLYRESRAKELLPVLIGHHGETMGRLLTPGFHSGTLPRLYGRMRRAAQREDERAPEGGGAQSEGTLGRYRESIREVEEAVGLFVERELGALLREEPRWTWGSVEVLGVTAGSNRVRVRLGCERLSPLPCEIAFEEQSGLILASAAEPGFAAALPEGDARSLFENALAGLYRLAGVDIVREQLEAALPDRAPYDVSDEGLLVWPGEGYRTELVYPLQRGLEGRAMVPVVRGEPLAAPPPRLDGHAVIFRHQRITWTAWVCAWGVEAGRAIPRLVEAGGILRWSADTAR